MGQKSYDIAPGAIGRLEQTNDSLHTFTSIQASSLISIRLDYQREKLVRFGSYFPFLFWRNALRQPRPVS